ncbi:MAG: tRNA uridine(34) 5-carboxymethylaminomethyl modification radical SAM/GNAT enzyme Elp3 [Coriobacteriia bacterium]|nr:tRNA uridine(34) 5-carboxymethylaminomethyl modification radical SAM/GNAT enzyme Elp3 [Coriobacteriia bacterium]
MESTLLDILEQLRSGDDLTPEDVARTIRAHNVGIRDNERRSSKKKLLRYYFETKNAEPGRWTSWNIDDALEARFLRVLRAKPRRTASGVATITVITKPWPCEGDCIFCPNDLRMPKSYVRNEPACQRAERNFFDPYLQVSSRLRALTQMGHITDKVELIVLGGSWTNYPATYQRWFVMRLFQALNEAGKPASDERFPTLAEQNAARLRESYASWGFTQEDPELAQWVSAEQALVNKGLESYNQAFQTLYAHDPRCLALADRQTASWDEVEGQQRENEATTHRCVGLVVETRPDALSAESLAAIRRLGATKVQIGVQSTREELLSQNGRSMTQEQLTCAFELLRLFGFKVHTHFMANLLGSTPEEDAQDFRTFVTDERFRPDEVKLYPCVLLGGTKLERKHEEEFWHGYTDEQLRWLMTQNLLATQPYTRVSRMIRDFSSQDILEGNRCANLRQIVQNDIAQSGEEINEIRFREVASASISSDELELQVLPYETSATQEFFLQWVTPTGTIAGFLRLSLPRPEAFEKHGSPLLPTDPNSAMIREVHVYGKVERLHESQEGTQHLGLGRRLVAHACKIAAQHGRKRILVISAIGTREYYRKLGFVDEGLYQAKKLR